MIFRLRSTNQGFSSSQSVYVTAQLSKPMRETMDWTQFLMVLIIHRQFEHEIVNREKNRYKDILPYKELRISEGNTFLFRFPTLLLLMFLIGMSY